MQVKLRGTNVLGLEIVLERLKPCDIEEFISQKKEFLKASRIIVNVGNNPLNTDKVKRIRRIFEQHRILFCGFRTNIKENQSLCSDLNIPCDLSSEKPHGERVDFIRKTIRSGERITSPKTLIIVGDVNPGAEIETGGSLYVIGNLRGAAKVGIGSTTAEVRAVKLETPRLEICKLAKLFERGELYINFRARVENGKLKVDYDQRGRHGR
ncbi:MAG: septum site-determining protein MinC [Nitrospiraceae bacterium]|nr:septum site-determining protein MinC [Nitrospiraceae bacterium]